jgi:predicted ATPase with chaperone activity
MVGPPGAGKSILASRFPGLLPPLSDEEALESTAIQSLAGRFSIERWRRRPFRSPHHTSSGMALVGGGCQFHLKSRLSHLIRDCTSTNSRRMSLSSPPSCRREPAPCQYDAAH